MGTILIMICFVLWVFVSFVAAIAAFQSPRTKHPFFKTLLGMLKNDL